LQKRPVILRGLLVEATPYRLVFIDFLKSIYETLRQHARQVFGIQLLHTSTHYSHCNTMPHTATHCNTLQHTMHPTLLHAAARCNTLQHAATSCNVLQHLIMPAFATTCKRRAGHFEYAHCNTLQHTATYCNVLLHTATRCSTLQHPTFRQHAREELEL